MRRRDAGAALEPAGAAASMTDLLRRHRPVAPELRQPALSLVPPISRWTLPFTRMLGRLAAAAGTSANNTVAVPGADGIERDALLYHPATTSVRGAVLWIHGGGRVSGIPANDDTQCRRLADGAGVVVLSIDYRLAPEHPFPAALDDCWAALTWFVGWSADNGLPPLLAVGGASAGGGLAAEVAQRATDERRQVIHQVLVYPMLDDRTLERPVPERGRIVWTPGSNRFAWSAYLGHPAGAPENRAYAVAARREDLSGLPSAWIGVGDLDLFHDEDVEYARRLDAAGVAVDLRIESGMYHGADAVPGIRDTDRIKAFHDDMAASLRRALDRAGAP